MTIPILSAIIGIVGAAAALFIGYAIVMRPINEMTEEERAEMQVW